MSYTYICVSFSLGMINSHSYKKYVRILSAQNWLKEQLQSPVVDFISIRKVRITDETKRNNYQLPQYGIPKTSG